MISILDYGMGNLGSLQNMFKRIGVRSNVISEPSQVSSSTKLVLPGVGSFDHAMRRLNSISGLKESLNDVAYSKQIPILGVCLGMQLMLASSDEGDELGLSWIKGKVSKFDSSLGIRVPHMGWNQSVSQEVSPLFLGIPNDARFYFAHSYFVQVDNKLDSIMESSHGVVFDSAINNKNLYGVQFHPEKSLSSGMKILKNFSEI